MKSGLILEDVPEAAVWMAENLRSAYPDILVTTCALVAEALQCVEGQTFDIALIDLNLPDGSGVKLIKKLNALVPNTVCVVVTIYDDDRHLFPALQAGAQGYLLKDMPRPQFIQRLQGITQGEPPLSPSIARKLLTHFSQVKTVSEHDLTAREKDVLILIAKGIKLADVAEMLKITRNTTAGYVKEIYRKLNISSRAEATLEAARLGLVNTD